MPDQEVHEIQLNGKQLVFMFMAATAVAVVIFFCGVMVGRGVRQLQADAIAAANTDTSIDQLTADPLKTTEPIGGSPVPAPESVSESDKDNLTYAERLESPKPVNEPSKLAEEKPPAAPAVVEQAPPPPPPVPAPKTDAVVARSLVEPPGSGFVLQVQVFPTRSAADALAGRLKGKGYPAFVTENDANPRLRYRVRVGKYSTRREVDAVSARLKQEEHLETWLTH